MYDYGKVFRVGAGGTLGQRYFVMESLLLRSVAKCKFSVQELQMSSSLWLWKSDCFTTGALVRKKALGCLINELIIRCPMQLTPYIPNVQSLTSLLQAKSGINIMPCL